MIAVRRHDRPAQRFVLDLGPVREEEELRAFLFGRRQHAVARSQHRHNDCQRDACHLEYPRRSVFGHRLFFDTPPVGQILETIAEADEDDDAEEEETDRNDMSEKLKELQHVLSAERKYEACLRVTCGACGPDASLLHRNEACINGQCASCGFARLWSNGVRRSLVEAETDTAADETADDDDDDGVALDVVALELDGAVLRNELHESWRTKITWKTYAHQQKEHDPTADRDTAPRHVTKRAVNRSKQ